MKYNKIIYLASFLASFLALAACAPATVREQEEANNFRPYIYNQQEALPSAYPKQDWSYPVGTPTRDIVARWREAGLVMDVRTYKNVRTHVRIGPQFYNLPATGQRGLGDAVAQMYNLRNYFIEDANTGRVVGMYAQGELQMY